MSALGGKRTTRPIASPSPHSTGTRGATCSRGRRCRTLRIAHEPVVRGESESASSSSFAKTPPGSRQGQGAGGGRTVILGLLLLGSEGREFGATREIREPADNMWETSMTLPRLTSEYTGYLNVSLVYLPGIISVKYTLPTRDSLVSQLRVLSVAPWAGARAPQPPTVAQRPSAKDPARHSAQALHGQTSRLSIVSSTSPPYRTRKFEASSYTPIRVLLTQLRRVKN